MLLNISIRRQETEWNFRNLCIQETTNIHSRHHLHILCEFPFIYSYDKLKNLKKHLTSSGHLVYTYIRASVVALHATVTADISFYVWHTLYSNIDTILLLKNLHFQKYINYIFIYHLSVLVRDASLADLRYLFLDKYQFRRATGDLNKVSTFKSNIYLFPIFVRFLTRYFSPVF